MYAPATRSQRAVRFAIAMAMVMAGALVGVPQSPPSSWPGQSGSTSPDSQGLPTLAGEAEVTEGTTR